MDIDLPVGRMPTEEKPIKVYPFMIDHLCEENARYWFYEMETQLEAQYAWEAIKLYEDIGPLNFSKMLAVPEWQRVNMKANLIMGKGLSPMTCLEIKHMHRAGERWRYLKEKFLTPNNAMKAMKLMHMANWTWDRSKKASKAWTDLKQLGLEFIEMNGSETIKVMDILLIWYLRGLGDDFKSTRDTLMSTEDVLEEKIVMSRVQNVEQMNGLGENASRASQGQQLRRPKGPKCYSCQGFGHMAARCPNQEDKEDDKRDQSSNNKRNGQRDGRGGQRSLKQSHKGRSAEDQDLESPKEEEYSSRAREDETVDKSMATNLQEERATRATRPTIVREVEIPKREVSDP